MKAIRYFTPALMLIVPLLLIVLLSQVLAPTTHRTVSEALIRVVLVVGLYIFIGNSGVVSFGHMTFAAVAAYATAWQTCCQFLKPITMSGLPEFLREVNYPVFPAAVAGVLLATLVAFLSGLILMRLSGLAASISTLALLFILNVVYSNWDSVTLGAASVVGLPTYVNPWVALCCAIGAILVAFLYQQSARGLLLRSTREDEVAAAAFGVSIYWSRLFAFTLSGAVVGLGGVLQAHFLGTVSVNMFFLNLTFLTIAMLVVGGMHSLSGAVVGVVAVSVIIDVFRRAETGFVVGDMNISLPAGSQEMVLAVLMLAILMFRKNGLMAGREFSLPRKAK